MPNHEGRGRWRRRLAGGIAPLAGLLTALPALAEEVAPRPYDPYIYSALAFIGGLVIGLGILVVFRNRIDRLLALLSRSTGVSTAISYHRDSIAERVFGYFIWHREDGLEWYSPYLRDLLLLDDTVQGLQGMQKCLAPEDYAAIEQASREFKEGYRESFERIVHVPRLDRYLECIGLQRHPPKEEAGFTFWFRDITPQMRERKHREQEVDATMRTLQLMESMLSALEFPLWKRDAELRVVYGNPMYRSLVGATPQQIEQSLLPELDSRAHQMAERARAEGSPQSQDLYIIARGERALYHVVEIPLVQEGGGVTFLGYAIDASRQQKAEEEVKRYSDAMEDLLESSASAMAIYGKDQRLVSYNNAFARLWRLDEGWLDDHPTYADVLERLRDRRLLPEQANFSAFKRENLEWFTRLLEPHEDFYYLPDGRVLRLVIIPHALGGLLFSYEDVTDRLALERKYNTMLAVQRASLDHLHEAIVLFDENRRVKLFNPEYVSLWSLDKGFLESEPHVADVLAHCSERVEEEHRAELKQHLLLGGPGSAQQQGRITLCDRRVLNWRSSVLPDGATLIAYSDITDSMLVEDSLRDRNLALEEADKVKTEFLANMSYELRSPLTSIMGFSEALISDYFGELNEKQRDYVGAINQASHRLMSLVNDILDLSTIAAGQMTLDLQPFAIRLMLEDVVLMLRERSREGEITIELDAPESIGEMLADEARIKQVIFNLLHNALKFSKPGGRVIVGASVEGKHRVRLWVQDFGRGIPEELQRQVFERFYKAGYAREEQSGAGLGLAMVKRFTELHGGEVAMQSVEGEGTTVTCILPRKVKKQTPASEAAEA